MIKYDRLWNTLAQKGMTQYRLIKSYGFSAGQIGRLKRNMHVSTHTLETLCTILECRIEDIVEFIPDAAKEAPQESSSPHTAEASSVSDSSQASETSASGSQPDDSDKKTGKKASKAKSEKAGKDKKSGKSKKGKTVRKNSGPLKAAILVCLWNKFTKPTPRFRPPGSRPASSYWSA